MTLYVIALVFCCLVAVGAMLTALRALENAESSIRETRIRSGVNRLAADFAVLSDDVNSLGISVRKLRNRENARHAREGGNKSNGALSDQDFLRSVERDAFTNARK